MGFLQNTVFLLLAIFYLIVKQSYCADPVYVLPPEEYCKKVDGRAYNVIKKFDCKKYVICLDGNPVYTGFCGSGTRFSNVTLKCEPGIKCFLEEEKLELSTLSPTERVTGMLGFVMPFLSVMFGGLFRDPVFNLKFFMHMKDVMRERVPGAQQEESTVDKNMKNFFEGFHNLTQKVSPLLREVLSEQMSEWLKVYAANSDLVLNMVRELKAKLDPLAEDMFQLLEKYSALASEARGEPFSLAGVRKDIETFLTIIFIHGRLMLVKAYDEMIA